MSHLESLTENRLKCKRNAVSGDFGHGSRVRDPRKPAKKREPKSQLQRVFLKRVQEEMSRQGVNPTQLSKREGAPSQTTINDIINGADPRLQQVNKIADALEVPVISLLTEQKAFGNIHNLPNVPTIAGRIDKAAAHKDKAAAHKARDRHKGQG